MLRTLFFNHSPEDTHLSAFEVLPSPAPHRIMEPNQDSAEVEDRRRAAVHQGNCNPICSDASLFIWLNGTDLWPARLRARSSQSTTPAAPRSSQCSGLFHRVPLAGRVKPTESSRPHSCISSGALIKDQLAAREDFTDPKSCHPFYPYARGNGDGSTGRHRERNTLPDSQLPEHQQEVFHHKRSWFVIEFCYFVKIIVCNLDNCSGT